MYVKGLTVRFSSSSSTFPLLFCPHLSLSVHSVVGLLHYIGCRYGRKVMGVISWQRQRGGGEWCILPPWVGAMVDWEKKGIKEERGKKKVLGWASI